MAASWLLQAIYTSLLSSAGDLAGNTGDTSPVPSITPGHVRNTVLANTAFGRIRGRVDNSAQPTIFRYLGVPYAKPPVGELHFQAPLNPDTWSEVREALIESAQCWQPLVTHLPNSEDCLYLNIYAPVRGSKAGRLPVMVFIHGGSYYIGAGSKYNGTELARKGDIVVVTVNYRLDVFGFLSTEDSVLPGNYGLLDQIQALKWIQQNIHQFGGDPNSVTIFGESSGSTSVSILVLSPLAKGLFHRAIMESGVSLTPWAYLHPVQKLSSFYGARMLGAAHGCDNVYGQSEACVTCMRNVDAAALINTSSNISNMFQTLWAFPRVETTFGVLPDDPVRLLAKGQFNHVDTIRGYNSHEEGLIKIDNYSRKVQTKEAFAKALRETLEPYAIPDLEGLIRQFLDIYIGNTTDPSFIGQQASRAVADLSFVGPTLTELYLTTGSSDRNKHYLYRLDYRDSFRRGPPWIDAVHMDELKYIFGLDQLHPSIFSVRDRVATHADYSMVDQMMTLWSNFARTGDPTVNMSTVQWEPFSNRKPKMLMINKSSTVADFSRPEVVRLYETILKVFDAYEPSDEHNFSARS